jgi:hypothetical protein
MKFSQNYFVGQFYSTWVNHLIIYAKHYFYFFILLFLYLWDGQMWDYGFRKIMKPGKTVIWPEHPMTPPPPPPPPPHHSHLQHPLNA